MDSSRRLSMLFTVIMIMLTLYAVPFLVYGEERTVAGKLPANELPRLGERMYRDGILPSGKPMEAVVSGDIPVDGTMFSCMSCHLRSGLGSFEGTVYSPPVNGRRLFMSFGGVEEPVVADDLMMVPRRLRPAIRRVPYNDKTLGDAIRSGLDYAGRELNNAMPRYMLDDDELEVLISYLKGLSNEISPGVTDTDIHFAAVFTDEVSPEDREIVLASLSGVVQAYNTRPELVMRLRKQSIYKRQTGSVPSQGEKDRTNRNMQLNVWDLKGGPESWQAQLEDYYRKRPVFALIGGMSAGDWRPVHEFCERNRVPSLLPMTDLPVISDTDWYTVYLSKGHFQEGEAAARYLAEARETTGNRKIVQVYRDNRQGRALTEGFNITWKNAGQPPVDTVALSGNETIDKQFWKKLTDRYRPDIVLYWETAPGLQHLELLANTEGRRPTVFVSYGLLKEKIYTLPESVRPFTYITYPYEMDAAKPLFSPMGQPWYKGKQIPPEKKEIITKAATLNNVLGDIFMRFDRFFYRDYLIELIDMMPDKSANVPLYPRISFGPGQRYAAKGCYIVQIEPGPKPALVKKSEWIVN